MARAAPLQLLRLPNLSETKAAPAANSSEGNTSNQQGDNKMMTEQQKIENHNKKLMVAIHQHEEILRKELAYSEDLQNKDRIERTRANIAKVKWMLK